MAYFILVTPDVADLEKQMLTTIDELQHWIIRPGQQSKRHTQDLLDKLKIDIKILATQAKSSTVSQVSPVHPSNTKSITPAEPTESSREAEEYHALKSSHITAHDLKKTFGFSDAKWNAAKVDVKKAIDKFLDPKKTPTKQDPEQMVEAVKYLRMLKDEGEIKWPQFHGKAKLGEVVGFIKYEIKLKRQSDFRKDKRESSKKSIEIKREE